MSTPASLVILLEKITALVDEPGLTWKEKRDAMLAAATEEDKTALEEFASWFAHE